VLAHASGISESPHARSGVSESRCSFRLDAVVRAAAVALPLLVYAPLAHGAGLDRLLDHDAIAGRPLVYQRRAVRALCP
jgi:hypothetical protein